MRRVRLIETAFLLSAMTLALVVVPVPASGGDAEDPNAQRARALLASELQVPASNFEVLGVSVARWPLTRKTLPSVKLRDRQSGEVHQVLLDRGRRANYEDLDAGEAAAFAARYGRLDPTLHDHIEGLRDGDEVRVSLWLNEPAYEKPPRHAPHSEPDDAEIERAARSNDAARAAFLAPVTGPVVTRLTDLGAVAEADPYVPWISTILTVAELRRVAEWPEVQRIYLDQPAKALLDKARPSIRAELVHNLGFTGGTVENKIFIAQIESEGGRVASHPNLSSIDRDNTYVCATPSEHATRVAGVIKSGDATRRGIAPTSILRSAGSCNGWNSELTNRSTAAADWGARALNLSWGVDDTLAPGVLEKFYDGMVVNRYRTIVVAAGNEASPCLPKTGDVLNPGLGYNMITVGAFNDQNTSTWADDTMYECSSYIDPLSTYGDREKPEVVAPGVNIITTGVALQFAQDHGTSFAAPMVTGAAALLMQGDGSLKEWPAGLRAIMIASAFNNITGFERLSDRDGAGGIDVKRAFDAARSVNNSGWDGVDGYDCADQAVITRSVNLKANRRARVALAWDNDPAWSSYSSRPSADFDLEVLAPGGTPVATSDSNDNSYEIVDFTPSIDGTYTLRFTRYRCNYPPWVVAWAWSNSTGP